MFLKGLTWTIVISLVLSVLAVFINRDKVESDLVSRAFASLSQFNRGWVKIRAEGRDLTFAGKSPLTALQKSALEAVENVNGVRIVSDRSTVRPKAVPYQWSATRTGTGFILKGYAPSPELRADIVEKARLVSGGVAVKDQMELADGAPEEGWSDAVEFGLANMDKLKTGSVNVDENAVRIEGEAKDVKSYLALTEAFQGGGDAPDGYILASNVSTPRVTDFVWSAIRKNGTIVLKGYAPGEESREEIEAMVIDVANGASVDNQLKLASGEPADWDERITFAIEHLKALKSGEVRISNAGIMVSGEAVSNASYVAMTKMNAPEGVSVTKTISRPVVAPFIWSARIDEDELVLGGRVPDEAARKALLLKARAVADGRKVVDEMKFAAGAPQGWQKLSTFALENLGRMKTGEVKLSDSKLALKGMARDEAALTAINSAKAPQSSGLTLEIMPPEPGPAKIEAARAAEKTRGAAEAKAAEDAAEAAETAKTAESGKAGAAKTSEAEPVSPEACQNLLNNITKHKPISFKTASAELEDVSQGALGVVAAALKRCPEAQIVIAGYADFDGDDPANPALSGKRARSVKAGLVKLGIGEKRMTALGYGETKPLVRNDMPENKIYKRHIEFIVKH